MSQPETLHHTACGEADESEDGFGVAAPVAGTAEEVPDSLPSGVIDALLTLLCDHVRIDFRPYRRRMVEQRIERRMKLLNFLMFSRLRAICSDVRRAPRKCAC